MLFWEELQCPLPNADWSALKQNRYKYKNGLNRIKTVPDIHKLVYIFMGLCEPMNMSEKI